jgi:hypothetical protein
MTNPITYANQFIEMVNQNTVLTQESIDYVYNNLLRGPSIQDDNLYNRLTECWLRSVRDRANWDILQGRNEINRIEGELLDLRNNLAQGRLDVVQARNLLTDNQAKLAVEQRKVTNLEEQLLFNGNMALVKQYSAGLDRNCAIKLVATCAAGFSGALLGPVFFFTFPIGAVTAAAFGMEKSRRDKQLELVEKEVNSNHQLQTEIVRKKLIAAINA